MPIVGNFRPDKVSFLPSIRYYAGNWATSQWLFRKDGAEEKLDSELVKPASVVVEQLTRLYGREIVRGPSLEKSMSHYLIEQIEALEKIGSRRQHGDGRRGGRAGG